MRDASLLDEIIRLRKLHLETNLSAIVEEAAQLLARERRIEAEALIENVKARIRYIRPQKAAASGSHSDQGDEHAASSAQSSAPR